MQADLQKRQHVNNTSTPHHACAHKTLNSYHAAVAAGAAADVVVADIVVAAAGVGAWDSPC